MMRLLGFYVIACLWTWCFWLSILAEKKGLVSLHGYTEHLAMLGQFGPFVAAALFTWLEHRAAGMRSLAGKLTHVRVSSACLALALFLPPLLFTAAIYINVWLGNQPPPKLYFPEPIGTSLHFLINLVLGGALGEEPGWRGYALPRLLDRFSALAASVVLALAWAFWHLPLWWIAQVPSSFPIYVLGLIPLTVLFTWLDKWGRGSLLVALLFHASLNTSLVRLPVFPAILVVNVLYWCVALLVVMTRPRAWFNGKRLSVLASARYSRATDGQAEEAPPDQSAETWPLP
jgi:membrane protease YdiL (CAAX protease family)